MNNLSAQVAKFSLAPNSSSWGQVHDFTPSDSEKLAKRGRLIAIIAMDGNFLSQVEALNLGREILTRLHEEYFGELKTPLFEALTKALDQVSGEFSTKSTKTRFGALALIDDKIIFSASAGIMGYVLRKGSLAQILNPKMGIVSGAGNIFTGDAFLLGTDSFLQNLSEGIIKAALEKQTADMCLESLTPLIYGKEYEAVVAAIVKFPSQALSTLEYFPSDYSTLNKPNFVSTWLTSFRAKMVNLIDGVISRLPERKISVYPDLSNLEERKNKKRMIFVGGLLLLLLVVSIVFGIFQRSGKLARQKYEDRLANSGHQLEEAKSLSTINQARSRELLLSARATLNGIKSEGVKDERVDSVLEDINRNIGIIAGIYEVTPELYLDLSLLSEGFNGDDLSFSGGRMLILDTKGKLVSVNLDSKKTRVLVGPEKLMNAKFTAVYADRNYVLKDNEIVEVLVGSTKPAIEKDWEDPLGIHAFSANIYLLDKGKNEIFRYSGSQSGFGSGKNWFAPGVTVDLSGVISWSIDGSIWLLTKSGEIEKYTNGNPQNFVLSGLEGSVVGARDIFTDEAMKYIYVLDNQKGRVIVIDKEGQYKAEYLSEEIKKAAKLVVSEEEKKIILMVQDKLYAIELKHI